jgi:small-conductance mechanosensitive channel
MRKRPIARIFLFLFLPSAVLLFLVREYEDRWPEIVAAYFPRLKDAAGAYADLPWRIALTLFLVTGAFLLVSIATAFLAARRARGEGRREMPALLRDLIRYGVFVLLVALILRALWGDQVTPLIGALGIGGVVLGFALQETLSNFFAGLALLADQPFAQGDWVRLGSNPEGKVEHITWRATKIRTRNNDYLIIPNSVVAKEAIQNFELLARLQAIRLDIGTSYEDPPDKVKRTLLAVVDSVCGVLKEPRPVVYLKSYADFSINYQIKCFIDNYERRPLIEDEIMNRIWYAFRRADIEIPFPIRTVHMHQASEKAAAREGRVDVEGILRRVPILEPLSHDERALLAGNARVHFFGGGEPIIRQGDPGDSMYVIASGHASVILRTEAGEERSVARLSPGDFFGEMSLLTGDPRTATVQAEGWLTLISVTKEAVLPVLQANQPVAERIAEIVTIRREGLKKEEDTSRETARQKDIGASARNLLHRIRRFFALS